MKKIIVLLLCLFALAACSTSEVMITDGEMPIIVSKEEVYTRQDLFNDLKNNDYAATIELDLIRKICDLQEINVEDIEAKIDEEIAEVKNIYGDSYVALLEYYGGEEGIRETLRTSIYSQELVNIYFDTHFEELVNEYKPIQAQLAYFDSLETANSFIEAVTTDATFDIAAIEFGYTTSTAPKVYTDKDSLAFEVKEYFNNASELGLSPVIETITTTTDADGNTVETPRYYLVNIIDRDANNFKDEFVSALNAYVSSDEILNYFFELYDIEFYDQRTYELLTGYYAGLK